MNEQKIVEDMNTTDNKGWVCPKCGAVLAPGVKECPHCKGLRANEGLGNGQQIVCD
jgi:uncharacterized OB-fold protein